MDEGRFDGPEVGISDGIFEGLRLSEGASDFVGICDGVCELVGLKDVIGGKDGDSVWFTELDSIADAKLALVSVI